MSGEVYSSVDNVKEYFEQEALLGGEWVVDKLYRHLSSQSTVLEIGSGAGEDLGFLAQYYNVTGSEVSEVLVETLTKKHPSKPMLQLNAVDLQTDLRFHCLYSNKVLPRLGTDEIRQSVSNQMKRLEPHGLICHTFWKGTGEGFHDGQPIQKYTAPEIISFFGPHFEVIELFTYSEIEKDDSILLIAEKLV